MTIRFVVDDGTERPPMERLAEVFGAVSRRMATNEVTLHARGHEHVRAAHESTFELTTDDWLTPAGDCIVGVEADTMPADLPVSFVEACRDDAAHITAHLATADQEVTVSGRGDPELTFDGERSMVFRTSRYVDDRTVMVGADAAAVDLDRALVAALEAGADLTVTLRVDSVE